MNEPPRHPRTRTHRLATAAFAALLGLWLPPAARAFQSPGAAADPVIEEPIRPVGENTVTERPTAGKCGAIEWCTAPALLLMLGMVRPGRSAVRRAP